MRLFCRRLALMGAFFPVASAAMEADVILVVDNSGSMTAEIQEVEANLNAFAGSVIAGGVDLRVVVISDAGGACGGDGVCAPPPLGNPAGCCPDQNLPAYRHVVHSVGSNDLFQSVLTTYPQWQASLRPTASKALILVSDNNDDMSVSTFMSQLVGLSPSFQDVQCHAIVATSCGVSSPCWASGNCAEAGLQYMNLAQQSGGIVADLCNQDFDAPFAAIANAVVVLTATNATEGVGLESWAKIKGEYIGSRRE